MTHPLAQPRGLAPPRLPACWRPAGRRFSVGAQAPETGRSGPADGAATRLARVEAALWFGEAALSPRRLARAAGLSGPSEARELVNRLREVYAGGRGALEVVEVAGGFRLVTRAALAPWIERHEPAGGVGGDCRLSGSATETLAVVAYRQPATRSEVEAIRGVGSGDVLRQLLGADLLRIVGRCQELGRPLLYGTTQHFLEVYGLGSLDDLPDLDEDAGAPQPSKDNAPATQPA
ncbi:SMC-Scp complex subunit ScpB [Botrimarina sp.]|uniref:SMC-Scp complex subunit ScpB n=1 Tax=Botrimarina sp. TaxID=2795802 RepID=UPI0032EE5A07